MQEWALKLLGEMSAVNDVSIDDIKKYIDWCQISHVYEDSKENHCGSDREWDEYYHAARLALMFVGMHKKLGHEPFGSTTNVYHSEVQKIHDSLKKPASVVGIQPWALKLISEVSYEEGISIEDMMKYIKWCNISQVYDLPQEKCAANKDGWDWYYQRARGSLQAAGMHKRLGFKPFHKLMSL